MTEDCTLIACPVPKNPVQQFANQYSLDGVVVGNLPVNVIINGVPISIPPNTINIPIPQSTASSITVQSCSGPITAQIPAGSTAAQIQVIAQNLATQAAQNLAKCQAPPPTIITPSFLNAAQTYNSPCTAANPLTITATLPAGFTQVGNSVTIMAGVFTSQISQADADSQALNFLTTFMTNLISGGQATCGVPGCSVTDSQVFSQTTAPFLYPSGATTVNVSVPNSAIFTPLQVYGILNSPFDGLWNSIAVISIIDPVTISIQAQNSGNIPAGTTLNTGSNIFLTSVAPTIPPPTMRVRIKNYAAFLAALQPCPGCAPGGVIWNGNFDMYFQSGTFIQFFEGSNDGGVDQNVNGSDAWRLEVDSNYPPATGYPGWACVIECNGGATALVNAIKFAGATAAGVYYVIPAGILGAPWGTHDSCMTKNIKCFEIEHY